MAIPKKVSDRIVSRLKGYQKILQEQKDRDVSEADTVTIVKDVLSDVFGYDKYAELTSEHAIRGTYCDLAVKIDGKLSLLIEVKAIGIELKENHVKQAINYGANQGCEWVVLTNGIDWCLYQIVFKKPIDRAEIAKFNLLEANPRRADELEKLYLITREGFAKSALSEYRDKKEATSRFVLAAIVLHSDAVKTAIRREIRRVSEILVDADVIDRILRDEVIKRETIEGDEADAAMRRVVRHAEKGTRKSAEKPKPTFVIPAGTPAADAMPPA